MTPVLTSVVISPPPLGPRAVLGIARGAMLRPASVRDPPGRGGDDPTTAIGLIDAVVAGSDRSNYDFQKS
jgi:hypothetical protein